MDIRCHLLDGLKTAESMIRQGPLPVVLVTAPANRYFVDRASLAQAAEAITFS
jgi:hypothetical protein